MLLPACWQFDRYRHQLGDLQCADIHQICISKSVQKRGREKEREKREERREDEDRERNGVRDGEGQEKSDCACTVNSINL